MSTPAITAAQAAGLKKIRPTGFKGDKRVGPFVIDRCGVGEAMARELAEAGLARISGARAQFITITGAGWDAHAAWVKARGE